MVLDQTVAQLLMIVLKLKFIKLQMINIYQTAIEFMIILNMRMLLMIIQLLLMVIILPPLILEI
ncbi:Uncharacterised protein [Mycobacteroides abscessus subsp. abscessus]|nr:Uncharacterised protein [Mycobacteroides abscessus subsp. abscessus]